MLPKLHGSRLDGKAINTLPCCGSGWLAPHRHLIEPGMVGELDGQGIAAVGCERFSGGRPCLANFEHCLTLIGVACS